MRFARWAPATLGREGGAHREKRPCPRPVRVRSASVSLDSIVRPRVRSASGPRPLPFLPGGEALPKYLSHPQL
eukprot:gene15903-biopygen2200